MTQQLIGVGSAPNDTTGDTFQVAFTKVNANFTQLYSGNGIIGPAVIGPPASGVALTVNGVGSTVTASFVGATGGPVQVRLTDGQTGNTVWSVNVGLLTIGDFEIANNTAGTTPVKIVSAGNITVAAPSSGVALTVTGFAGSNAITATGPVQGSSAIAPAAGGSATCGFLASSTANLGFFVGTGPPTFSAAQGSIYSNITGVAGARLYYNTTGSTTWVAATSP
jgi:hypothetical protein